MQVEDCRPVFRVPFGFYFQIWLASS